MMNQRIKNSAYLANMDENERRPFSALTGFYIKTMWVTHPHTCYESVQEIIPRPLLVMKVQVKLIKSMVIMSADHSKPRLSRSISTPKVKVQEVS